MGESKRRKGITQPHPSHVMSEGHERLEFSPPSVVKVRFCKACCEEETEVAKNYTTIRQLGSLIDPCTDQSYKEMK